VHLLEHPLYIEDVAAVAALPLDWALFQDKTVVISGASGMIGSFVVDALMAKNASSGLNCTVYAWSRQLAVLSDRFGRYDSRNLVLQAVDVNAGELPAIRADYVIHAASNTHPIAYSTDPVGTIMTNVQGTHAMLDLAVRSQAQRMLFVSTVEIYGQNRGDVQRFSESDLGYIDCNTARAGYPESKRTGESLCQSFRAQYGMSVSIPRLPRVYGPTMRLDDSKALSQFIMRAVNGQDVVLKSAGTQQFSYCHAADAASAILTCLVAGEDGAAYNVAHPSSDVCLKDLAGLVASIGDVKVVFELPEEVERRGYSAATLALMDGSKLQELGWAPIYDLRTGLERTISIVKAIA